MSKYKPNFFLLGMLAFFIMLFTVMNGVANAQDRKIFKLTKNVICEDVPDNIFNRLDSEYGEGLLLIGSTRDTTVSVFYSNVNKTMTVLETLKNGTTCIVVSSKNTEINID